jgi:hypothetical protein
VVDSVYTLLEGDHEDQPLVAFAEYVIGVALILGEFVSIAVFVGTLPNGISARLALRPNLVPRLLRIG